MIFNAGQIVAEGESSFTENESAVCEHDYDREKSALFFSRRSALEVLHTSPETLIRKTMCRGPPEEHSRGGRCTTHTGIIGYEAQPGAESLRICGGVGHAENYLDKMSPSVVARFVSPV